MNILVITLCLLLFAMRGYCLITDDGLFVIENIDAYNDFGNVAESKKMALDDATSKALITLLQRIAIEKTPGKFNEIAQQDNSRLVKKYIMKEERITSHSYSATVDVHFNIRAVKSILNTQGISFAEKIYNDCLIIPFFQNNAALQNLPVRWNKFLPEQFGLVSPIMIRNDLDEVLAIDTETLMRCRYEDFKQLLRKYRASHIMLVQVIEEDNQMYVKIKFITQSKIYNRTDLFEKMIDEDVGEFDNRIILNLLNRLDSWWKGNKSAW